MAVHFSDEEKEKLKQDKASIYEDHTDEAIKEEIKNLSWKGKLKQFQHYYQGSDHSGRDHSDDRTSGI